MIDAFNDEHFMGLAMKQALEAYESGEVPVGAIIVSESQVIARARNSVELLTDVTAHAEMLAITAAMQHLNSKYLSECTLYVTLEPCPMCAGALRWSQVGRIVYGAEDEKSGFMRFGKDMLHPRTKVEYGIMHDDCANIMTAFFRERRQLKLR